MSVYVDTHDAIHEAVKAFATAQSITCAYPNAKFTAPRTASGRDLAWMRLSNPDGEVAQEVILAGDMPTYRGAFTLSFFAPYDSGTSSLAAIVQAAIDYFPEGSSIGPATIQRHTIRHAPNFAELFDRTANEWDQFNLIIYFRAE